MIATRVKKGCADQLNAYCKTFISKVGHDTTALKLTQRLNNTHNSRVKLCAREQKIINDQMCTASIRMYCEANFGDEKTKQEIM